jgi:hypothetical protein
MPRLLTFSLLFAFVVLSGCATIPTGPSVMSLPGTGKSFDRFRIDDASCRQFAYEQVGGVTSQQAAQNAAVTSALVGTALGAAAGVAEFEERVDHEQGVAAADIDATDPGTGGAALGLGRRDRPAGVGQA